MPINSKPKIGIMDILGNASRKSTALIRRFYFVIFTTALIYGIEKITPKIYIDAQVAGEFPYDVFVMIVNYALANHGVVFPVIVVILLVKAVIIIMSAEELNRAAENEGVFLYRKIVSIRNWRRHGLFFLFNLAWYLLFFFIGALAVFFSNMFSSAFVAWIVVGFVAVAAFPVFYAGISLGGFYYSLANMGSVIDNFIGKIRAKIVVIYLFYLVRSIAEVFVVFVAPIAIASALYGDVMPTIIAATIAIIVLMYLRTTAVMVKRQIFDLE